jgi:hypothetical protein
MNGQSSLQRFLKDDLFRWKIFAVHFVLFYLIAPFFGWIGVVVTMVTPTRPAQLPPSPPQFILQPPAIVWFAIVAFHFILTLANEIERAKKRQLADKPKRHHIEVGDDGELVEIVEDETEEKQKNRL